MNKFNELALCFIINDLILVDIIWLLVRPFRASVTGLVVTVLITDPRIQRLFIIALNYYIQETPRQTHHQEEVLLPIIL